MRHKFVCPNCGTKFKVDVPDDVRMVMCPTCGTNIPVIVDEVGTLGDNLRQAATREGNWILWAAAAFAGIWGLVVLLMVMSSRRNAPPVAATAPPRVVAPAPPPVVTPVPTPAPTPAPKPAPAPPPTSKPPAPPLTIAARKAEFGEAEIVAALRKGIDFILNNMRDGEIDPKLTPNDTERHGVDALAVYALLHCSQSIKDDRISITGTAMKQMIDRLKRFPMNANLMVDSAGPITYSRSLRASALAIYNRPEDRDVLSRDLAWLLRAAERGAYGYDDVFIRPNQPPKSPPAQPPAPTPDVHDPRPFNPDNSNSQYGLIGVWNCAEAGLPVPNSFWQDVERHWTSCQARDGTWSYQGDGGGSFPMTMAGITALSVCRDFMSDSGSPAARAQRSDALARALAWLETGDNAVSVSGQSYGYSLYGLERAALASGMMFAGRHDIYRELAAQAVRNQHPNGAFGHIEGRDAVIETSFHLLFLARGRNPVLLNKLRYAGNWANHQRDAANLARYASYAMERPVNWQVVSLSQNWGSWMDSPILYIAGDAPPTLAPADYDRLRAYAENGGLIFTHADNGSSAFSEFARELAANLFPKFPLTPIPDDDDLFTLQFNIAKPRPKLSAVSNGSRRLMVHSADDLAGRWHGDNPKRNQAAFEMGLNLFIYATGKGELRGRNDSVYLAAPAEQGRIMPVARIQHEGNWDPEPAAWPRFVRYFANETGWTLQPKVVLTANLKLRDAPVAVLTGTSAVALSSDEARALRRFVQEGGTLFIDSCGGSREFAENVKKSWLPAIFPGVAPRALAVSDPILVSQIPGIEPDPADLPRAQLRPYAAQVSKPPNTKLLEVRSAKGRIIFSEIDVTTGLLGTQTWGVSGYSPAYAQAVLRNIVLEAAAKSNEIGSK